MGAIIQFGGRVLQTACALIAADAILTGGSKLVGSLRNMTFGSSSEAPKKAGRPKTTTKAA